MSPATETRATKETPIPHELAIMHAARRLGVTREVLRGMMIGLGIRTRPGDYGNAKMICYADFLRLAEAIEQHRGTKAIA